MGRTPPPSRRVSTPRKQPTPGPSKPRKPRVPSAQFSPGPSNVTNLRPLRRSSRLSGPLTVGPALARPSKALTPRGKGKGRMQDDDEMAMDVDAALPAEIALDVMDTPQRVDKGKEPMVVDEMLEEMRALVVSERSNRPAPQTPMRPPMNPIYTSKPIPFTFSAPKQTTPLRREAPINTPPTTTPNANANVAPTAEIGKKDQENTLIPHIPPFSFRSLLRNPKLLIPQEGSDPDGLDAEKRFEAERVRNALAIYRVRNLEGVIPLKNWNIDSIISWANHTRWETGKLSKSVHIPRPQLDPLVTNGLSSISLMYNWVRRIATLAGKAVSMTISTPLASDLHTRWEVMNTKMADPYFGHLCFMPYSDYARPNPANVVIGVQTPFGLNPNDFKEFVRTGSFPVSPDVPLQGKYHSWANLYDACKIHGTRWFALTSYTHWVFGMFSVDYSTASVSPIYAYNNRSPNIVILVAYWFASARNAPESFVPPFVDIAIGYKSKEALKRKMGVPRACPAGKPPTRQDYWDGKHDEPGTKTTILTRTDATATSLNPNAEVTAAVAAKVNAWNSQFPNVPPSTNLEDVPQPKIDVIPLPPQGEWMIPMQ